MQRRQMLRKLSEASVGTVVVAALAAAIPSCGSDDSTSAGQDADGGTGGSAGDTSGGGTGGTGATGGTGGAVTGSGGAAGEGSGGAAGEGGGTGAAGQGGMAGAGGDAGGGGAADSCATGCEAGWLDADRDASTGECGCECQVMSDTDLVGDGIDANCDGIDGDADSYVFVSNFGDDTGIGTLHAPVASLPRAVALANDDACAAPPCSVLVAEGSYVLADTLDASGVTILGATTDWEQDVDAANVIIQAEASPGIEIHGSGRLERVTVIGANMEAGTGEASIAVRVVDATDVGAVVIADAVLQGGQGGSGRTGDNGAVTQCTTQGGAGGYTLGPCEAVSGGDGDAGGDTVSGGTGGPGGTGDCGYGVGNCSGTGGEGQPGTGGNPGGNGDAGVASTDSPYGGFDAAGTWSGGAGNDGQRGDHGTSGGGGGQGGGAQIYLCSCTDGLLVGGRGGPGGRGGCGGGGGHGGQQGGGSFALLLQDSRIQLPGTLVIVGTGGQGGAGGRGSDGADGEEVQPNGQPGDSRDCDGEYRAAGPGGPGGNGGGGGGGGGAAGGNGGPAIGIALLGTSVIDGAGDPATEPTYQRPTEGAAGGDGGPGGIADAGDGLGAPAGAYGTEGIVADTHDY